MIFQGRYRTRDEAKHACQGMKDHKWKFMGTAKYNGTFDAWWTNTVAHKDKMMTGGYEGYTEPEIISQ